MVTCGGYHTERETSLYQSRSRSDLTSFCKHSTDRCRTHHANANGVEFAVAAKAEGGDMWDIRSWLRVRRPFFPFWYT